jgi:hypothetical protein
MKIFSGRLILSLLLILTIRNTECSAQNFSDVADEIGVKFLNGNSYLGNGLSFFDVDEDGWDDLTFCIAGSNTRYYRNIGGTYVLQYSFYNTSDSKACVWLDYDEDGDNDLLVTRRDAPTQLWKKNNV